MDIFIFYGDLFVDNLDSDIIASCFYENDIISDGIHEDIGWTNEENIEDIEKDVDKFGTSSSDCGILYNGFEMVCGVEIHAHVSSKTKLFSRSSNDSFGASPNSNVSFFDIAIPGTLPLLNRRCVELGIKTCLALNCVVNNISIFERKHYFYPDLPQGYQISQLRRPIGENGFVSILLKNGSTKKIRINRIQLEQDAGKSIHDLSEDESFLDFNRSGCPLMEIVSEADMRSIEEVISYIQKIRSILIYIGSSTAKMEEGEFRADINISLRRPGEGFGERVEIKNLNSTKFIEKAIAYEIDRQFALLSSGKFVDCETRSFDTKSCTTSVMRSKETALDYRYFRDVDILPLHVSNDYISEIQSSIPELPDDRSARFVRDYGLTLDRAIFIVSDKGIADFFELCAKSCDLKYVDVVYNWIVCDLYALMNESNKFGISFPHDHMLDLVNLLKDGVISTKIAKEIIEIMWRSGDAPSHIVKTMGLQQINDISSITEVVQKVFADHAFEVRQYLDGKDKLFGFFVGQTMKGLKGKGNPELLNKVVLDELNKLREIL